MLFKSLCVCICVYLSHFEPIVPAVDAVLKGLLEGREGQALHRDDVVIQQLGCFIWALDDVGARVLVGQHIKNNRRPLILHLCQRLGEKVCIKIH